MTALHPQLRILRQPAAGAAHRYLLPRQITQRGWFWPQEEVLVDITSSLPRLVTFDISLMHGLRISASCAWELMAHRCPNLRRVYCQLINSLLPAEADEIVRVQREAPHVCWHLNDRPCLAF